MLSRVIGDIYHLKRVHAIMPDHNLGTALADKIQRLNLKPAVAALPSIATIEQQQQSAHSSSPGLRRPAQYQLAFTTPAAAVIGRQVLPDPNALCQLLECLAYFELGRSTVASDAMTIVRACLPLVSGPRLARILAAACALGQQEPSVLTLPLLTAALQRTSQHRASSLEGGAAPAAPSVSSSSALSEWASAVRVVSPSTYNDASEQGIDVIKLMEALQAAEVHQEEVWSQVAEHCVREMDAFDGKELFRVIELLYLENVTYYPDFFIAAESYLSAQPYTFLSSERRQQLVEYYKELGQPVVSLLAAGRSGATDTFDAALAALPSTRSGRRFQQHPPNTRLQRAGISEEEGSDRGKNGADVVVVAGRALSRAAAEAVGGGSTDAAATQGSLLASPVPVHASSPATATSVAMDVFVQTARKAIHRADEQALLELLHKCELKDAMDARVMDAAVTRLSQLCFGTEEEGAAKELPADDAAPALQMRLVTLAQLLRSLFAFDDPAFFHTVPQTAVTLCHLLDAITEHRLQELHSRVLPIALGAVTVLPPARQPLPPHRRNQLSAMEPEHQSPHPAKFYTAVVRYLHDARDTLASEGPNRLLAIATILHGLPSFGGVAVLHEYLPFVSLAVANASMRVRVELAALLASVPSARPEALPVVFKSVTAQKGWSRRLHPAEAKKLLEAMMQSRMRDAALIAGVVELVQQQRQLFEPSDLVWFLHSLAVLGVRDLEFFSSTAEFLLGAVSPVTRARTSVHDLCETLYVFTFVLKGVIRVVQQMMARLKVSAGQATPRDITLALYSFVKLQVARHHDVTGPFCDRAVVIYDSFKGEELASVLGSLRALRYCHEGLMKATARLLVVVVAARGGEKREEQPRRPPQDLTDAQYISLVAALHSLAHTSAARRNEQSQRSHLTAAGPVPAGGASLANSLPKQMSVAESTQQSLIKLFAAAAAEEWERSAIVAATAGRPQEERKAPRRTSAAAYAAVSNELRRASLRLLLRAAPADKNASQSRASPPPQTPLAHVSGVQLYLIVVTLAAVRDQLDPPLSSAEWALLAVHADTRAEELSRGYADVDGCAAAEVVTALHELRSVVVPALPSEEGGQLGLCAATVERWQSAAAGVGATSLAFVPPRLSQHVQRCLSSVVANAEAREGLKRAGLLGSLTAAVGGGDAGFDLHGATLVGGPSAGDSGRKGKHRKRGGTASSTSPSSSTAASRQLTLEGVLAAIDAEHVRRQQEQVSGRDSDKSEGPGTGLFAPVGIADGAALTPEDGAEEWLRSPQPPAAQTERKAAAPARGKTRTKAPAAVAAPRARRKVGPAKKKKA